MSWLPSAADMPTRASQRQTTKLSKAQLHERMRADDVRRRKQAEAAEKKAARLAALKKPPMTQAERLAEAALVEKRNAKSLNRWEEAERLREEERRRKIAALHSRKLDGPVVSFWSGALEIEAGQAKAGLLVAMEEKVRKNKKKSAADAVLAQTQAQEEAEAAKRGVTTKIGETGAATDAITPAGMAAPSFPPSSALTTVPAGIPNTAQASATPLTSLSAPEPVFAPILEPDASVLTEKTSTVSPPSAPSQIPDSIPPSVASQHSQQSGLATSSGSMAPPPVPSTTEATSASSGVLAAPVLASPFGAPPQIPMLGFAPNTASNVLAPPNTSSQAASPSVSQFVAPVPPTTTAPIPTPATAANKPDVPASGPSDSHSMRSATLAPPTPIQYTSSKLEAQPANASQPEIQPEKAEGGKVARFCILLQDFDDDALKDKQVVNQILFGRKMSKLASKCILFSESGIMSFEIVLICNCRGWTCTIMRHNRDCRQVSGPQDGHVLREQLCVQGDSAPGPWRVQVQQPDWQLGRHRQASGPRCARALPRSDEAAIDAATSKDA
jgi:vacuolar protein sorting-associated protein 72